MIRRKRPDNGKHVVRAGEWFQNVALSYGYVEWKELWYHQDNSALANSRKYPEMLVPGDEIVIPERSLREEPAETEQRHTFQVGCAKDDLLIRLLDDENYPIAGVTYELKLNGLSQFTQKNKKTDADGFIEEKIPRSATEGELILPERNVVIILKIGSLHPIDSKINKSNEAKVIDIGVRQRFLNLMFGDCNEDSNFSEQIKGFQHYCDENSDNLGYDAGPENGQITPELRKALMKMHDDNEYS